MCYDCNFRKTNPQHKKNYMQFSKKKTRFICITFVTFGGVINSMVGKRELTEICKVDNRTASDVVHILRREWCPFVKRIDWCGLCTEGFCGEHLRNIMNIGPDARSFFAVLRWRIREERAIISEKMETPKLERNRWGDVRSRSLAELARRLL